MLSKLTLSGWTLDDVEGREVFQTHASGKPSDEHVKWRCQGQGLERRPKSLHGEPCRGDAHFL